MGRQLVKGQGSLSPSATLSQEPMREKAARSSGAHSMRRVSPTEGGKLRREVISTNYGVVIRSNGIKKGKFLTVRKTSAGPIVRGNESPIFFTQTEGHSSFQSGSNELGII